MNGRVASRLLLGTGSLLAGFALSADLLGVGGPPGIGTRQAMLLAAGLAACAGGLVLSPFGRPVRQWIDARWAGQPLTGAQCILLAVCIGSTTGAVEVLHSAVLKYGFGTILKQPVHLVWMAPLSYTVLFALAGSVLAAVARAWPRVITLPSAAFVLLAPAAWSQLLLHPRLAGWAVALLCLGAAGQGARWLAHRQACGRTLGRGFGGLGSLVVVAGLVATWIGSRGDGASNPAPPRLEAPNVLLVVLDTVRADHLSLYGYDRITTPHVEALAEEAIAFDWAISTAPWTLPSHASMFTGRYHHQVNADWITPLDDTHPTLAEVLSAAGYATGGFVGNLVYCLREHGIARGFETYEDIQVNLDTLVLSTSIGRYAASQVLGAGVGELATNNAETVTDLFLDWLPDRGERPFFAFLNYIDAHALYLAPERFRAKFGDPGPNVRQWYDRTDWNEVELQQFRNAYDSCIAYIDEQLGRVFTRLREANVLDDTIVIVTSDHGEHFGEHGLTDHGNSLYRELLHVPLIIRMPGGHDEQTRLDDFVSLRDLPRTILDATGADPTGRIPGQSLARLWSEGPPDDTLLLSEVSRGINTPAHEPRSKGDMKSLFRQHMHYIRNGDRNDELYDLNADPREETNLFRDPAAAAHRAEFERILQTIPSGGSRE